MGVFKVRNGKEKYQPKGLLSLLYLSLGLRCGSVRGLPSVRDPSATG